MGRCRGFPVDAMGRTPGSVTALAGGRVVRSCPVYEPTAEDAEVAEDCTHAVILRERRSQRPRDLVPGTTGISTRPAPRSLSRVRCAPLLQDDKKGEGHRGTAQ